MRTYGVKVLDGFETAQLQWLVLPVSRCPDEEAEQRVAASFFKLPHEPWASPPAFVQPVVVRRSRRRVLFCQQSGLQW
jgi:hypothetical protein